MVIHKGTRMSLIRFPSRYESHDGLEVPPYVRRTENAAREPEPAPAPAAPSAAPDALPPPPGDTGEHPAQPGDDVA